VLVADVIAAVVITGLATDCSAPAAEVVAVTADRFANSPVPVLSATQKYHCKLNDGRITYLLSLMHENKV